MLEFESVTLQNFLSIGAVPQTVSLSNGGLTLVLGLNLDTGDEDSRNGSGKTSLIQAVSYGLYGEPLSKIRIDNLVNDINAKNMLVTVRMRRDGVAYRIERGRKPNVLRFFVGDEEVDMALGENRQTQLEIERVVGMSRAMFHHIVALNTTTLPFLRMRPAEQREVIEELMGITQISAMAEQLKLTIDGHRESLRAEEAIVKATSEANARIERAVASARAEAADWDRQQALVCQELGQRVAALAEIDITAELALLDAIEAREQSRRELHERERVLITRIEATGETMTRLKGDLVRYKRETMTATNSEVEMDRLRTHADRLRVEAAGSCQDEIERVERAIQRVEQEAAMTAEEVTALEAEHATVVRHRASPDAHRCHACGQGLTGTEHLAQVLAAVDERLTQLTAKIAEKQRTAATLYGEAEGLRRDVAGVAERHAVKQLDLLAQADAIQDEVREWHEQALLYQQTLAARIAEVQQALGAHDAQLQHYSDQLDQVESEQAERGVGPVSHYGSRDAVWQVHQERERATGRLQTELQRVNPHASTIAGLVSTLSVLDYGLLDRLTSDLKHEQFLYKLLTSKDSFIRKRIIDQNLHYLNWHLNSYLQKLRLPHEVRFLPDLTVEITLSGREKDFESLSRGEMNRVILANSWAFRDLWENLNFGFSIMAVDELLDQGLDRAGVSAAAQVLRELADRDKNIFLISHREELGDQMDRTLTVTKQDGFSSVLIT